MIERQNLQLKCNIKMTLVSTRKDREENGQETP